MNKQNIYTGDSKLSELICRNCNLLLVMSRFGISLGFGDNTVQEVCEKQNVDTDTFLAVANFMEKESPHNDKIGKNISVESLVHYLQQAHSYFLDFCLPAIRRKLIESIDYSGNDLVVHILKFYDEYVNEVRSHMEYEDRTVFKYVDALLNGKDTEGYSISVFEEKHNQIAEKMSDLKNTIIKYYPSHLNPNQINSVLFDIFSCEKDLTLHCKVEDLIFIPAIRQLEEEMNTPVKNDKNETPKINALKTSNGTDKTVSQEILSKREKEIITCIAKGMSNKEIADKLFLSTHTVITHRKNITRKLQIYSPAGLTIYAIVNKLIKLQDVN
ncbi:MAG: helix-turn-helix transcriptional regulator [Culturomica sp.]|jgi:regulator of cell morphogenesis and NO signaling|nr:helix-turn-helix transcriptional regulator [Culturomica sp.]